MTENLEDVLDEIDEYLENRADCDCYGDPCDYQPNKEMSLLSRLRIARGKA